jgi:hypothetical protein
VAEVGTSGQWGRGLRVASGAYAPGPDEEEEICGSSLGIQNWMLVSDV